jgi:hypothetical protein
MAGLFATMERPVDLVGENDAKRAREFKGSGTPFLKVPGCKSVEKVFVGGTELPASIKHRFPVDADGKDLVSQEWPMYDLSADEVGTPTLLRSVQSNDGIWQDGISVTVVGEWDDEKKPARAKAPASETVEP